jgi:hypothetical protein
MNFAPTLKAYIQTLREFARRRKFAHEYTALTELARSKIDAIRSTEIGNRTRFYQECGQYVNGGLLVSALV